MDLYKEQKQGRDANTQEQYPTRERCHPFSGHQHNALASLVDFAKWTQQSELGCKCIVLDAREEATIIL